MKKNGSILIGLIISTVAMGIITGFFMNNIENNNRFIENQINTNQFYLSIESEIEKIKSTKYDLIEDKSYTVNLNSFSIDYNIEVKEEKNFKNITLEGKNENKIQINKKIVFKVPKDLNDLLDGDINE